MQCDIDLAYTIYEDSQQKFIALYGVQGIKEKLIRNILYALQEAFPYRASRGYPLLPQTVNFLAATHNFSHKHAAAYILRVFARRRVQCARRCKIVIALRREENFRSYAFTGRVRGRKGQGRERETVLCLGRRAQYIERNCTHARNVRAHRADAAAPKSRRRHYRM